MQVFPIHLCKYTANHPFNTNADLQITAHFIDCTGTVKFVFLEVVKKPFGNTVEIMIEESQDIKIITRNKKATHEYHIQQTFEAGIALVGTEVKSLRAGKANLIDSYAAVEGGEVYLIGAHISEFKQGNINNHEPRRKRKLLLHNSEIRKLYSRANEKGLTIIPLALYFNKGKVKVEIALAQGKNTFDKRESIAKKDMKRDLERSMKY